jgi:hypothetical protein
VACYWAVICLKPEGHPQLREVRSSENEFLTGFRFFVFDCESARPPIQVCSSSHCEEETPVADLLSLMPMKMSQSGSDEVWIISRW